VSGDLEPRARAEGLLRPGAAVVVLLSGGRDSVCLLDLAVRIAGRAAVDVLHVDYGLRADSAADAAFCAALCERLGVPLELVRAQARPAGGNLQGWARDLRYGRARALAAARDADVAAGHTASDQAETVLYRLAAAPSRRALLGMAPRSGPLIRPLLSFTREETGAHCEALGLSWRDDPSNDGARFARNRVRAGLLPALRAVHPGAEANVVRTAALLRDEAAVLDEAVRAALDGRDRVELDRLRGLPAALARLIVVRLAEDAAGTLVPRAGSRAAEILALDAGRPWTALDVGDGVRAVVENGVLRMEAAARSAGREAAPGPLTLRPVMRDPEIGEILVQPDQLQRRVRELGQQISTDYAGRNPLLIGVLKGAVFFLADLMREITCPVEVDFMAVASYGSSTASSGVVRILKDLDAPIEGRDVIIVEDIVDSGLTLQYLMRNLGARSPASLEVCALLTKPDRRKVDLPTRYLGFEIPDRFAIGYGLDHDERYRNLPYVAALEL
jgi:hypoxanthine phosphoribosyltransferase